MTRYMKKHNQETQAKVVKKQFKQNLMRRKEKRL